MAFSVRNFVLNACQYSELAFYGYVELVSVVNHLLREGNVLFVGKAGAVNHHRAEAHVDAALAGFERIAVVEVKHDFGVLAAKFLSIFHCTFCHVAEQSLVGVSACALGYLQDNGALLCRSGLDDGLQLFHVVEVEGGDSVAALDGACEHFARVHQT